MKEKTEVVISLPQDAQQAQECQPLLGQNEDQQSRCRCQQSVFRDCGRSHSKSKKRVWVKRGMFVMILALVCWSVSDRHHLDQPGGIVDGHHANDSELHDTCRREEFVRWNGPSRIEPTSTVRNVDFSFGRGNMFTKVNVQTLDSIQYPLILVEANTTKVPGDGDGNGNNAVPEAIFKNRDSSVNTVNHGGLHVRVIQKDDSLKVLIWADRYIGHHDDPDREDDHDQDHEHDHHHKFCAEVAATILLPKRLEDFGRLAINGTIMTVDVHDLSSIVFQSVKVESVVGAISFHDQDLKKDKKDDKNNKKVLSSKVFQTNEISLKAVTGAIKVLPWITSGSRPSSLQSAGSPVKLKVQTTVGSITIHSELPTLAGDAEDQRHEIELLSNTGSIQLNVRPESGGDDTKVRGPDRVPGEVHILAASNVGQVQAEVFLAEEQPLFLKASSSTGHIRTLVDDKFLGNLSLSTQMGSVQVIEAEDSASEIQYSKNTRTTKVGRKQLKQDRQSPAKVEGTIDLTSSFGRDELVFL